MLEDHLKSPVTQQRLRAGPVADYVDGFAEWLHRQGYRPRTIEKKLLALAASSDWMRKARFTAHDLLAGLDACKAALARNGRVRYARGPNSVSLVAAETLIRYLREQGILPTPKSPSLIDRWPLLGEFRTWMCQHRGIQEMTLDAYQIVIGDMLAEVGDTPATYTAATVRDFVLRRAKPYGTARARHIVTSVRAFLRFLGATGRCAVGLGHAIPRFAGWHLAKVPRYLEPSELQRVLDACTAEDGKGLRDRAVVLLLVRLGLRASDVTRLRFAGIDWKNGRLAVCGKGRRHEWLPLPQDIGDAILRYVREGRPPVKLDRVFTRVMAPYGPLTYAAISHIARSAQRRAGLKAPFHGAHVFRHSAATAMLRQGVSLAGVGAVLRHRSPSTTALYAKVDFGLLREVAQPWPEVSPC